MACSFGLTPIHIQSLETANMLNVTERAKAGPGSGSDREPADSAPPSHATNSGPVGSPMIIVLGAVALISMFFGFILGRLF